jgi:hypothetical protein
MTEPIARVEQVMRLMIGEHVISEGPDMKLKRAMELLNTAAESWAQKRVDESVRPLVEALQKARAYVEADETTHGRKFGAGDVIRKALEGLND